MTWISALESLGLAAVLGVLLGRLCMEAALRMRWVDRPGHRKIHRRPVPYLGGVALIAAGLLAAWTMARFCGLGELPGFNRSAFIVCALPAIAAVLLGLWDDLFDLRPRYKFWGQLFLAFAFSQFAYRFTTLHLPGFLPWLMEPELGVLLTTFFIVAVANGYNMMDGSDALCLGASSGTLLAVAVAAHFQVQPHLELLTLCGTGACLGLLVWNRPPARIYLGDAGSQGLGFLAACVLVALAKGSPGQSLVVPASQPFRYEVVLACLMLGWPAVEVVLTVARRSVQGRGLGRADQGHIHHRLARLGLGPRSIAFSAFLLNLGCGAVVLAFLAGQKGLSVLLMLPLAGVFSLGMQRLGYMRFFNRDWLDDRRPHFAVAGHFAAMQSAKLKLARDSSEVLALVEQACREFGIHACRVSLNEHGKRRRWAWNEEAPPAIGHRIAWDRVRLAGTRIHASWSADMQDDREPELSMNLRVVMVEFMRRVLERLGAFAHDSELVQTQETHPKPHLGIAMSIRSLKQRL